MDDFNIFKFIETCLGGHIVYLMNILCALRKKNICVQLFLHALSRYVCFRSVVQDSSSSGYWSSVPSVCPAVKVGAQRLPTNRVQVSIPLFLSVLPTSCTLRIFDWCVYV